MPTRATIIAEAEALLPDNDAREISPEDTRQRIIDLATEYLHITDDADLLKLKHINTKAYLIGDVTYYGGDFYQASADNQGAFDYSQWTLFYPIKDWVTATNFRVGHYANNGNLLYKCLTAHVSGTFATDLAAVKWVLVGPVKATEQEILDHTEDAKYITPLGLKKHTMITKLNMYTNFG
jgi:hypothetical protein